MRETIIYDKKCKVGDWIVANNKDYKVIESHLGYDTHHPKVPDSVMVRLNKALENSELDKEGYDREIKCFKELDVISFENYRLKTWNGISISIAEVLWTYQRTNIIVRIIDSCKEFLQDIVTCYKYLFRFRIRSMFYNISDYQRLYGRIGQDSPIWEWIKEREKKGDE